MGPCPSCGAESRSRSDRRRLPISLFSYRWKCWACGKSGDLVELVVQARFKEKLPQRDPRWGEVRDWFERRGFLAQVADDRAWLS